MKKISFVLVLSLILGISISRADTAQPNFMAIPNVVSKVPAQEIKMNHSSNALVVVEKTNIAQHSKTVMSKRYSQLLNSIEQEDISKKNSDYLSPTHPGLIASVSPEYTLNKNFLSLSKISNSRRKQSLMFVFLMNEKKHEVNQLGDQRKRLHVMAPKKVFLDQKVIDDEYFIDLSVANYSDGYASREWNFVVPNKKPKEVALSLLWSF